MESIRSGKNPAEFRVRQKYWSYASSLAFLWPADNQRRYRREL